MITKEQLQAMSDFEVNKALAELLGAERTTPNHSSITAVDSMDCRGDWLVKDYCNKPNDIMPLQEKHHICVVGEDTDWCAFLFDNEEMEFSDKKLCRAIACCLILVLQEK